MWQPSKIWGGGCNRWSDMLVPAIFGISIPKTQGNFSCFLHKVHKSANICCTSAPLSQALVAHNSVVSLLSFVSRTLVSNSGQLFGRCLIHLLDVMMYQSSGIFRPWYIFYSSVSRPTQSCLFICDSFFAVLRNT